MEVVIHLTNPGPDHWRRARARARQLKESAAADDTVTLIAELVADTLVIQAAESAEEVVELDEDGVRVTTNRTCLEKRAIPIDAGIEGFEILENSTRELVRLQGAGAGLVKIP